MKHIFVSSTYPSKKGFPARTIDFSAAPGSEPSDMPIFYRVPLCSGDGTPRTYYLLSTLTRLSSDAGHKVLYLNVDFSQPAIQPNGDVEFQVRALRVGQVPKLDVSQTSPFLPSFHSAAQGGYLVGSTGLGVPATVRVNALNPWVDVTWRASGGAAPWADGAHLIAGSMRSGKEVVF